MPPVMVSTNQARMKVSHPNHRQCVKNIFMEQL